MKNQALNAFLLMIAGVALLSFFTPWWCDAIWIIMISAIMGLNRNQGLLTGAISIALIWLAMALYMSLHDEAHIISKTGDLLGGLSTTLMILVTFVIAFITGLLSGWLGSSVGYLFRRNP